MPGNESHEGDIHTDNLQRSPAADTPVDAHELAAGLMLVRASTLKMIRLQLAIERRDRRAVLEAVDELVELDTRLQECLAGVPGLGNEMFAQQLEAERSTLNREKLTLVSGVSGRPDRLPPAERPCFAFEDEAAPAAHVQDPAEAPPPPPHETVAPQGFARAERPRRSYAWAALLLIVISVCAGEAYLLGGSETLARLVSAAGAFQ